MSMNNLAASFFATGQSEKSLALHGETLKLRRELLGFDHPETLRSMNNLAHSCAAAGQSDKALALYEETLELRREKLGANHPDTLFTVNDLCLPAREDRWV
jgi:tetratricopeptide (TPR) repeat protein